jgi:hypothetical protein
MANAKTRTITLRSIISCAAFRKGYEEAKKGLPINSDGFDYKNVWQYERGRQFAFCYDGRLKEGNRVRIDALHALAEAMNAEHVI